MASPRQIESNRRNALRSTGPKTADGKAKCSRNAYKHGADATEEVRVELEADEFATERAAWGDPGHVAEVVVERAARANLRLKRAYRWEDARLARRRREAEDAWRAERAGRLEEQVGRLLERPATTARELEGSVEGVDWMLFRWKVLDGSLKAIGSWRVVGAGPALALIGTARDYVRCDARAPGSSTGVLDTVGYLEGLPEWPARRGLCSSSRSRSRAPGSTASVGRLRRLRPRWPVGPRLTAPEAADRALFDDSPAADRPPRRGIPERAGSPAARLR